MKRVERAWMYERLDHKKKIRSEFVKGVGEFIEFTMTQDDFQSDGTIRCPCRDCRNLRFHTIRNVKVHLYNKGFCEKYFEWVAHGESMTNEEPSMFHNASTSYENMVRDAFPTAIVHEAVEGVEQIPEDPNPEFKEFFDMLKNAKKPLWDGCTKTVMEMATRLIDMKCEYNLAHRCVDGFASFLEDFIPKENSMTRTFYDTKKILKGLELPVEKIHVCPNGCMLFWKNDCNLEKCKVCGENRYKMNSHGKPKARKILIYFPLTPRLQRLYATSQTAEQMRWHSESPSVTGTMAHPRDGKAWKHFDSVYPEFASKPRNVRLGLCTDGFTPYGKFGGTYSCWPVMITPYNLPPSLCMKREFIFLSLLIPGPKAPKANLDVYLQPLIEKLNQLWTTDSLTYDVSRKQNFTLKASIMWTINDFPAYGKKVSWFDCHRWFLPTKHPYQKNKNAFYKDRVECGKPPKRKTGEELLDEVSNLPMVTEPNFMATMKTLKSNGLKGWNKKNIFWELSYWKDLLIRHNLDVMHIEKNFFEQLIHTIMNVKDHTSDNPNARKDLPRYCNRPELEMKDGEQDAMKPKAPFELDNAQKKVLLEWVQNLKFPDGYASDFSRCVDLKKLKLTGMKSHDCHVFLERLLPVALKHLLPDNVWKAVTEISQFFRDLCAPSITVEDMRRLESNIPEIICKLEKIFPPSFFNSMEHLAIHLPYEALVGGPVQFIWMYPFERFLNHLKKKIGNKARVEGSICNAYLTEEIANFCTRYLGEDVDTKSRDLPRNAEKNTVLDIHPSVPSIFRHNCEFTSTEGKKKFLDDREYDRAHLYVLSNCLLGDYEREFEKHMIQLHPNTNSSEVWSKFEIEFPNWFQNYVIDMKVENDIIRALAMGPSRQVKTWNRCYINGFNFHTFDYGKNKTTMNYGVFVKSMDGVEYFGILEEILELTYYGSQTSFSALLFKCTWMDSFKGLNVHKNYKLIEVNHSKKYPKYDPFVLAIQASQVYYSSYPTLRNDMRNWWAVFKTKSRPTVISSMPIDSTVFQDLGTSEHATLEHDVEEVDNDNDVIMEEFEDADETPSDEVPGNAIDAKPLDEFPEIDDEIDDENANYEEDEDDSEDEEEDDFEHY